ncbi:hypothetical protein Poli38472_008039 [Pythium oligandrum]|uniref:Uncharacterized protein n=1 Tax=Pythium oligandrum TaxID=41045 RepID=A0A8K1CN34_PYTOL|nr:hypothetical protein Poli38472_008039 [Pythium oligandrum]|eukprot:TMW65397.1 hypothetical protein Poli38472_008039 [Pythium oligandrum]
MRMSACLALTVVATTIAQAAPCDMSQLKPILEGPDMQQCRQETSIKIPAFGYDGISPYSIDTEECENPSCGKAIMAIKALKLPECDLDTQFCSRAGCETIKTSLFHNHLDVIDAKCPNGLNVNAIKPPASSNAMDSSVKCTEEGLRAAVWDVRTSIESCLGVELSELVDGRNKNRTIEDMESLVACYRCSNLTTEIQQLKDKLPTCQLAFGVSFRDFLVDNAEFCTAKADYEGGNLANEWLIKRVMNSSQLCGYQKLYTYFNPYSSN